VECLDLHGIRIAGETVALHLERQADGTVSAVPIGKTGIEVVMDEKGAE
jgi:hypothetical protein